MKKSVHCATCKARWGNIRDNYRKSLRKSISKRSRGLKSVKHYKYADHLWFLKKCFDVDEIGDGLGERLALPGVEIKQEEDSLIQIDPQEEFSDDDSHCQSPINTIQKKRKLKQDTMEQTQSSANSTPQHYSSQKFDFRYSENESVASNVIPPHCVDSFLASLTPTLKNLSPINWHFAKAEMFAIVQKFELKTILGEENEQSTST
ncbi:uncharacterized protein LOC123671477 isoform X2 [Harmonia axyridis]|uniref:uncharacterized protein LOC123671477 isoform X2 n=1 Tax=Harmonia axyridis TaxID=115357 RepID=UPI001E278A11|nr:uncharacterized protein LOC123671477 isoform X2 [Harmonia axyridis]